MDMDMVYGGVVVLGRNWIGVGADKDHVVLNGEKKLVSVVVRSYAERMVSEHRVGLVGSYKAVHHIYQLGMHCIMVFVYDV